jgi:hypothetical protein
LKIWLGKNIRRLCHRVWVQKQAILNLIAVFWGDGNLRVLNMNHSRQMWLLLRFGFAYLNLIPISAVILKQLISLIITETFVKSLAFVVCLCKPVIRWTVWRSLMSIFYIFLLAILVELFESLVVKPKHWKYSNWLEKKADYWVKDPSHFYLADESTITSISDLIKCSEKIANEKNCKLTLYFWLFLF